MQALQEEHLSDSMKLDVASPSPHSGGVRSWLNAPVFPALVGTIGCLPLLVVHFQQLWSRPHYQYFPMVLVAVAILYQLRRTDSDREIAQTRPLLAGLGLLAGVALASYAVLRISPLLCCTAWLLTMVAFVSRTPVKSWAAWALLWLLLRLPQGRDVWLIQWLQKITTQISSGVLDQLHIDHIQEGHVLAFPDRKLLVEEACSGVVSLFTIVATAAIFGAFLRRSFFHTILLMVAGAFWAGAANILRVVSIAVCIERYGIDLTSGWPHDFLGLAVFCVTLVTLFSTDALLRFVTGPVGLDDMSLSEQIHENLLVRIWNRLFWPRHERQTALLEEQTPITPFIPGKSWGFLVVATSIIFCTLSAVQIWGGIGPFSSRLGIGSAIDSLAKESLPHEMAGWTMTEFHRVDRSATSEFGHHSRQWTFRQGDLTAIVSIDFPFPEWHNLDVCYRGVGWKVGAQSRLPDESTAMQHALRNDQQTGQLIYDIFDQQGAPYQAPPGHGIHPRWRRLLYGESTQWAIPTYYQVQILSLHPTLDPIDPLTLSKLQALFIEFRDTIRQRAIHSSTEGQR